VRRDFDAIDDRASIDFTPPGVKRWASGFQERPSLGGASQENAWTPEGLRDRGVARVGRLPATGHQSLISSGPHRDHPYAPLASCVVSATASATSVTGHEHA